MNDDCEVYRSAAVQYGKFDCKKADAETSTIVCESHSNAGLTLPVDDIPQNTESLFISIFGNSSLKITTADVFRNFKKLHNLSIHLRRSLQFSEELLSSTAIENLKKVLFDLPNLNSLSLEYTEFNRENYSWMLPEALSELHLSNGVFEFDLLNCPNLASLRLNHNELNKIPSFHNPVPALVKLDLRYNPLQEFTVNDIAGLCALNYYAMDVAHITNCECKRLKEWIVKLKDWGEFTFEGNLNCDDNVGSYTNCTLDEAMLKREKCSSNIDALESEGFSFLQLGLLVIIITITCCCVCSCCSCLVMFGVISELFGFDGIDVIPGIQFDVVPGSGFEQPMRDDNSRRQRDAGNGDQGDTGSRGGNDHSAEENGVRNYTHNDEIV